MLGYGDERAGFADVYQGKHVIQAFDYAEINWTLGVMTAVGIAAPRQELANMTQIRLYAEESAREDARIHLRELLAQIQVMPGVSGRSRMAEPAVMVRVDELLAGCDDYRTRYYADGGVDVVVRCLLSEGLTNALRPSISDELGASTRDSNYTTLIVDASSVRLTPVLWPSLRWKGRDLLWASGVSGSAQRAFMSIRYVFSMQDAESISRPNSQPIVVKLSNVQKEGVWEVSGLEAAESALVNQEFLREGQVIIVIRPGRF